MAGVSVNLHASALRLAGAGAPFGAPPDLGVLLIGASGAGKSDLLLRLIALGAQLVADDRTDLFLRRGRLYAKAPARIAGLIEVRGLGIVRLPYARQTRIHLVAELKGPAPRLPERRRWRAPAVLALKLDAEPWALRIVPFEASAPVKIAVAAAAYALNLKADNLEPN